MNTTTTFGRQIQNCDFAATKAHARRLCLDGLRYQIKDCREAMHCAEEIGNAGQPNNYGRYRDEMLTYQEELNRRLK